MSIPLCSYELLQSLARKVHLEEAQVGISSLSSINVATDATVSFSFIQKRMSKRPTAFFKCCADDFYVEENVPLCLHGRSFDFSKTKSSLLVVYSSVPASTLSTILKGILPSSIRFYFTSPLDHVSVYKRFIWIKERQEEVRKYFKLDRVDTPLGEVLFGELTEFPVSNEQNFLPLNVLPDLTYTVVLRNVSGSLSDILEPLRHVCDKGFINFSPIYRHGMHVLHVFNDAKYLLQRDYTQFLLNYAKSVAPPTPSVQQELDALLHLLQEENGNSSEWRNIRCNMYRALKSDSELLNSCRNWLCPQYNNLFRDFINRCSYLYPKHNDPAVVLRESISRNIMREKLRTISDIIFNIMASARWNLYGSSVAVGDVVITCNNHWRGDVFEAASDRLPGWINSSVEKEWISAAVDAGATALPQVKIVGSKEEAREYSIYDVVLPVYGKEFQRIVLPSNASGDIFDRIINDLPIEGLPQMDAAPEASYRHLMRKLAQHSFYISHDSQKWDWLENAQSKVLKNTLYRDQNDILRMRFPLSSVTSTARVVSHPNILQEVHNLQRESKEDGMTCVFRASLTRGSSISSVLREIFRPASLTKNLLKVILK